MSSSVENCTPITTNNSLRDVVEWLKKGDVVTLRSIIICRPTENNDSQKYNYKKQIYRMENMSPNRKITVTVDADLLNEGEWPYHIKSIGAVEVQSADFEYSGGEYYFELPSM